MFLDKSSSIDQGTTEEVVEIMNQRDTAILKNKKPTTELDQQRSGAMEVVQPVAPAPDALPRPCGMNALPGPPTAPALIAPIPSTLETMQMGASSSTQAVNLQDGNNTQAQRTTC